MRELARRAISSKVSIRTRRRRRFGSPGFLLLVRAESPYRTAEQLIQAAKAKPGTISYGSWGTGNTTHLIGELFTRSAGIDLLHVPYKGSPLTDFLGGHVDMTFLGAALAQPLLQETLEELGVKGVDIPAWSGLFAPAGMPPPSAQALQRDVATALQRPEYLAHMKILGTTVVASTPQQFSAYVSSETQRYKKQLALLGVKLD